MRRKDACEYSLAQPEERRIAAALVEQLLALGLLGPRDYSDSHHQLAVTDLGRAVFALPARLKRTRKALPRPRPTRRLKVAYQSQGDLLVPTIRVAGLWLEALGFRTGRRVRLEASAGRLVIITAVDDAEPDALPARGGGCGAGPSSSSRTARELAGPAPACPAFPREASTLALPPTSPPDPPAPSRVPAPRGPRPPGASPARPFCPSSPLPPASPLSSIEGALATPWSPWAARWRIRRRLRDVVGVRAVLPRGVRRPACTHLLRRIASVPPVREVGAPCGKPRESGR
ncbi:MAG TPA: SymE family type I addiction module toxin [Thermoanaerobaculia bacterium]|nr:SymE family type I addiction module toxin [Thermoanaerobaculia bacterium]